jgi:E3 ubiquitin-protein ligase HECTD1
MCLRFLNLFIFVKDEDGKTPLDKARERNDEGHREVAAILQSPGKYA